MRASFYECDVTPPLGGFMWGYYCQRYAEVVHDRLFSRALVIEDKGRYCAFAVVDTCVIPREMHEVVTERIKKFTGIEPSCVCISSNHSHTGAPVFDGPEVNAYADKTYTDVFYRLVADSVILAYKRLEKATAKFAKSELRGYSYCRNAEFKSGIFANRRKDNPEEVRSLSEPDYEVPIMYFEREGKPIGAIVSFALHQDTVGRSTPGYSGDYSCILSKKLKEKYGEDFVTIFLIGACGDVNHIPGKPEIDIKKYELIGEALSEIVIKAYQTAEPVSTGIACFKERLRVKTRPFDTKQQNAEVSRLMSNNSTMRARNMLFYISSNPPEYGELIVQCIKIGSVIIAALPGEIYTEYGKRIKELAPASSIIVAENCNSYCGYIPSRDAFDEKSDLYESSLCYHSCYVPEAGDILVERIISLANLAMCF